MSGAGDAEPVVSFTRSMGLTHTEFFRSLPPAIAGHPYEREGHTVSIAYDGRSVTIVLGPERTRAIAALRLPCVEVTFTFRGFPEDERRAFMDRFDRYFLRGGG